MGGPSGPDRRPRERDAHRRDLGELLAEQHGFEERRLLAGAVAYFVSRRDVADDLDDLRGIDDDARVVRAVCRALGREDPALGI